MRFANLSVTVCGKNICQLESGVYREREKERERERERESVCERERGRGLA